MHQLCSGNFRISICFLISAFIIQFLSTIYATIWILGFELKIFGSLKLRVCVQLQLVAFPFLCYSWSQVFVFLGSIFVIFFNLWYYSNGVSVDFYPLLFQIELFDWVIELLPLLSLFPLINRLPQISIRYSQLPLLHLLLQYLNIVCYFAILCSEWFMELGVEELGSVCEFRAFC